jgi:hypothetical protein
MNDAPLDTEDQVQKKRLSWWQRFLAWLARGAAAAQSDRPGPCPP